MSKKKKLGTCHICLNHDVVLTKEHIPPASAFNEKTRRIFIEQINGQKNGQAAWGKKPQQGGLWKKTLCQSCNNNTGAWYGGAYASFVKQCAEHLVNVDRFQKIPISFHDIYPLRIIKQIFCILCNSSDYGMVMKRPWLRAFLLNRYERHIKDFSVRIMIYLCPYRGLARSSGVAGILKTKTREIKVLSEFFYWPLGMAIVFDKTQYPEMTDISLWSESDYDDRRDVNLDLLVHPISTAYPNDFRTQSQLAKERVANF